ncbi:MAG: LarC family nickel insertion protein, partial [Geminicoccaceae bacterium]|nr:LarC family nickel insertion protein [Geminicoccaceae bacterium]
GLCFAVAVEEAPPSGTLPAILERIERTALDVPVKRRARSIYRRLGAAEAEAHGIALERVHFHELADWDSYADILAAACAIEALGCASWSVGPLPLGSGSVATAHGALPVPAPATVRLLEGFEVYDDGLPGERITPTGAAILAELAPASRPPGTALRLLATGHGLGSRELPGKPNLLRALLMSAPGASGEHAATQDRVAVLRFEVDDQPAEDLALGLARLRERDGVLDVCQWPVLGKAGRLASAVQVLCEPEAAEAVAAACLVET